MSLFSPAQISHFIKFLLEMPGRKYARTPEKLFKIFVSTLFLRTLNELINKIIIKITL